MIKLKMTLISFLKEVEHKIYFKVLESLKKSLPIMGNLQIGLSPQSTSSFNPYRPLPDSQGKSTCNKYSQNNSE